MATDTTTAVLITGYLPKGVATSKHKSARAASGFIRSIIKKAGGKVSKLDVMMGTIFITLKDEKGIAEVKAALHGLDDVAVQTPTQGALLHIKAKALGEAELLEKTEKDRAIADALAKKVA